MNIKCRVSGLTPDAVVLVATIRALKMHSGKFKVIAGKPLDPGLSKENLEAVESGCENLEKQIENMRYFGVPVVVAINKFSTDTKAEIELVKKISLKAGAIEACTSDIHAKGGAGGIEMAEAVVRACEKPKRFKFLYPLKASVKEKIETIARKIYGAKGVSYLPAAEKAINMYTEMGYGSLPICMAKTHESLSHDKTLKGRPSGFTVPIRDVRLSAGAGFLYPLLGEMRTMPGLPSTPAGEKVDIDADGKIIGLF